MRKFLVFILVACISFFIFTTPVFAFTSKSNDEVNITTNIKDDVYAFGGNVSIEADVDGDLVTAGGRVVIDGNVSGDLIAAGGYLNLNGNVGDDARISGGVLTVDGVVEDDLMIGGGRIVLTDDTEVGGDLIISGGTIELNGKVNGDAILSGGTIKISGKIGGNVRIENVGELTITGDAEIAGDVVYSSPKKANISDDAIIGGEVKATISERAEKVKAFKKIPAVFFTATYFGGKVISFVSLFVLGIILILVIPRIFSKFNDRMKTTPGMCAGAGAIMLFGIPIGVVVLFIISILLFISIIATGLGIIAFSLDSILIILYILLIYVSTVFLSFFVGRMVLYRTSLDMNKYGWKVLAYLVGLAIVMFAYNIPFIGWMIHFAGILFGFGGLMLVTKDGLINLKK